MVEKCTYPKIGMLQEARIAGAFDYAIVDNGTNTATILDSNRVVAIENLYDDSRANLTMLP